ncbi:MAG TPA: hypothetical protein VHN80_02670 [Kineosporiaceae bacterium]|nr:hypothetical protein [Kineosporiaceae bacterium]
MPKLRAHNIALSLDGYLAGPGQSPDHPLGVGGEQLHEWAFARTPRTTTRCSCSPTIRGRPSR